MLPAHVATYSSAIGGVRMRQAHLVGLVFILLACLAQSARAQAVVEHALVPPMDFAVAFFADDARSQTDAAGFRLKGPVANVRTTKFEPIATDGETVEWTAGPEVVLTFDEAGSLLTRHEGQTLASESTPEYRDVDGARRRIGQIMTTAQHRGDTPVRTIKTTYTYDASGRIVMSTVDADDQAIGVSYEYDDQGRLVEVVIDDGSGTSQISRYNEAGRLTRICTSPDSTARRITVNWPSPTRFELRQGPDENPTNMGEGTLDDHGALLHWSFRPPMRGPNMIQFRNEITYDQHGNWTQLVSYTEAKPGEVQPSKPVVKYVRTITYR